MLVKNAENRGQLEFVSLEKGHRKVAFFLIEEENAV